MALLNQIVAVEKGLKARVYADISTLHKIAQKPELFNGFHKNYQKVNVDDQEALPPESKLVQYTSNEMLRQISRLMNELMTIEARREWTNMAATADVSIDGEVIIKAAPITYLLFLEKQLTDLRTFIEALPVLDAAETWTLDENSGLHKTSEIRSHRTKKVQKALVLLSPTVEHPGQAVQITDDVLVGHWVQIKQSGAMAKTRKAAMLERVEGLLNAVKMARELANAREEVPGLPNIGEAVFKYVLAE